MARRVGGWPGLSLSRSLTRSLGGRFVATSLGLLLVVQLTSFLAIDASLHRHALGNLPGQLEMGSRSLQSLLEWRAQHLTEGARLLAADYGFRAAVQTNDRETIASVLSNHGARIGASEVALLSPAFEPIATADGTPWDAQAGAAAARLAQRGARPAGSMRADHGAGGAGTAASSVPGTAAGTTGISDIVLVAGQPRQRVLVPMKAPVLVAWVLMYFPLPPGLADEVHQLAAADLTVLARPRADAAWTPAVSRLAPELAAALATALADDPAALAGADAGMLDLEIAPPGLPTRRMGVHLLRLSANGSGTPDADAVAVLTLSIDDALRPPRDLQFALLITTLLGFVAFGLGSIVTARRISTPLQQLADDAQRLGLGDAVTPIASVGSHEVRELALALEQMRASVASKQEQIVQSEKLASIGQLAAGVAHEINNPIGFVFSNFGTLEEYLAALFRMLAAYQAAEAELEGSATAARLERLREEIELDYLREDIPALMAESKEGIKRVRKIVQDLKDFSHVDARQEWERVDLHQGLDSTLNIVGNEIKYKADVVKDYATLPAVECLPGELNQVFMNLLVNAAHAIGDARGTITLKTGTAAGANGPEVWVEVGDNGSGIAPADLKRIFDPFFTTKPVGKGTGLGLSLSYGIVKKHGGRIEVDSELGRGTRFRVSVPVDRVAVVA